MLEAARIRRPIRNPSVATYCNERGVARTQFYVELNILDPHIPARVDAAADPAFEETAFLQAMIASGSNLLLTEPDPAFRNLIGIIQNATGLVATG